MRLKSEQQILDVEFRKKVISEIEDTENVNRKNEMLKRYEVFKDKTNKYVRLALEKSGLEQETIATMMARCANISMCKKIIQKKARAYSGGVVRTTGDEETDNQINELYRLLDYDSKAKKSDRYRELYKNCMTQTVPEYSEVDSFENDPRFKIKKRVLSPWEYDVIEDAKDREVPRVVILSEFTERDGGGRFAATEQVAATHGSKLVIPSGSNAKDDIIADSPEDQDRGKEKEFIWWGNEYHFTTDINGEIIPEKSPEDLMNPIQILPFSNVTEEQDGRFWAEGGDDLTDGCILVNLIITDMFGIAYMQGYGQFVVTGKNLKEKIVVGPHNALVFDYDPSKEDPKPEVQVVSGNPPLDMWMASVEQYVALLLSTNNISTATVSIKLDATNFASGIAMLIDRSEAIDEVEDKQKDFKVVERNDYEITKRWHNLYFEKGLLIDDFAEIGSINPESEIAIKFLDQKAIITEEQKLKQIEMRKKLGINEQVDLIMIDHPDLTREEAEEKLMNIKKEKLENAAAFMQNSLAGNPQENEENDDGETSV